MNRSSYYEFKQLLSTSVPIRRESFRTGAQFAEIGFPNFLI